MAAQSLSYRTFGVIPAKAGIHRAKRRGLWNMGPRFRGDDSTAGNRASHHCPPSPRLLEQLPADQHAPDLAGAGADLVELGVAQIASGRVVVDVAVAAEQLYGIERDLGGVLGGVEDRAGGVLAGGFAAVAGFRHGIDVRLAGVHADIHVGDLALHQLKLADRLAELLALVD